MMIRGLLFLLLLYTLLVWVVSVYLGGDDFVQRGLFWTAVGIASLIAWLILERLWSWWRVRQARQPALAEAPSVARHKQQHADDAAFGSLLAEAEQRLAESARFRGSNTRILDLPMYLMLGGDGAGKTSILEASGMEPKLLAGQVSGGDGSIIPTRLVNIWLAKESLYLEIGGRIFGGDLDRFTEFLECLRARPVLSTWRQKFANHRWRRWFQGPDPPPSLRGVLLFFSTREFKNPPDVSKIEKSAQQIRERLDAVAAHFGTGCPIYVLFTKADSVPFYQDFFSRFSDSEAGQVFGVLSTPAGGSGNGTSQVWAIAEARRLAKCFNSLFLRLSNRRLLTLATEVQPYQKPAIYEFPREFNRIRETLVQFLVDVFKPNPLKASPVLRGFFFSGTRQVERSTPSPRQPAASTYPRSSDVTQIFRPEATEILTHGVMSAELSGRPQSLMVTSWMFITDFFHTVLAEDRPLAPVPVRSFRSPIDRYGTWLFGSLAALGLLFALLWTVSYFSNRSTIAKTAHLIEENDRAPVGVSHASLLLLDRLRSQLENIRKNESWVPHWGLYAGERLYQSGRTSYFRRLRTVLLDRTNATLVGRLRSQSTGARAALYDSLKAHLTITKLACPAESSLNEALNGALKDWHPELDAQTSSLAAEQFAYYTSGMIGERKLPVPLTADDAAIEQARGVLRDAGGLDQQLNVLLSQANKQTLAIQVQERIPDYAKVLSGPGQIAGSFTRAGVPLMEQLIDKGNWSAGEECVVEATRTPLTISGNDADTKKRLLYLYYSKYADTWRQFLGGFSVLSFNSAGDAAMKLERISGPQSPLLALVKLVADNTNFPAKADEKSQWVSYVEKFGGKWIPKKNAVDKVVEQVDQASPKPVGLTAGDVTLLFQPTHIATPPAMPVLVSENNQAYINGLRTLQQHLEAYARASGNEERSLLIPPARQSVSQAKMGLAGLADRFANVGNQGLNSQLTALLEQPIQFADRVIPMNAKAPLLSKLNGDLAGMCSALGPILRKYPFSTQSQAEVSIDEIRGAFAPKTGRVWVYQQTLGESVVRQGSDWLSGSSKPQASPALLAFLNQAQRLSDAFFAGGAAQPRLVYSLRPVPGPGPAIHLILDGKDLNSSVSKLRAVFAWPAAHNAVAGATAEQGSSDFPRPFGQYDGPWGVFRFFQNADRRGLDEKRVQWSEVRGRGVASAQRLTPPAMVEFVDFPGGVDVFNPMFFEAIRCPSQAVIPE